jgi:hypothetical protein
MEIESDHFHHPGLRRAQFIFCDDKPNENGQGIEYEDFAEIAKSAVGTPVKVKFLGQDVSGHIGSVPIGHIAAMHEKTLEDGSHQLVADAVLFADDYPDEIEFLEKSFAEGNAPGVSWELSFNSTLLKDGVKWLKGLVTRAATFVRNPAYGSRTALLALASNKELNAEQFMTELSALVNQEPKEEPKNKGGNSVTVEELQAKLAEAERKIADLEAAKASLEGEKTSLEGAVTELRTTVAEQDKQIHEFSHAKLIEDRTKVMVEAGLKLEADPEKLAKKQQFWAGFSEEAFAEYVDDLKAVAPKRAEAGRAAASRTGFELPRYSGREETAGGNIRERIRNLKNAPVATE